MHEMFSDNISWGSESAETNDVLLHHTKFASTGTYIKDSGFKIPISLELMMIDMEIDDEE